MGPRAGGNLETFEVTFKPNRALSDLKALIRLVG